MSFTRVGYFIKLIYSSSLLGLKGSGKDLVVKELGFWPTTMVLGLTLYKGNLKYTWNCMGSCTCINVKFHILTEC